MPKSQSQPPDFPIHVDGSCLTDSTDLQLSPKRNLSDQTVIHNEPSMQTDEHTEALIHAAARAIISSIENGTYNHEGDSAISGDGYYLEGTEMSYEGAEGSYEGTELSYDDDADHEGEYDEEHMDEDHNEHDTHEDSYDGSSSSHPEDDDVFSDSRRSSQGGSLNSSDEQHTDEDSRVVKKGANLLVKEQDNCLIEQSAEHSQEERKADELTYENMSRLPSTSSSHGSVLHPTPLVLSSPPKHQTPSKILTRPPFRTPSSVRALQMSSPTPSIFSSPRSSKRPKAISRSGTPNTLTGSPSRKTPTRFKMKKEEQPLVLLHVTVLPLRWTHSDLMDIAPVSVVSNDLQVVRESWKLLKEKLGDTVFERGILLPHPQDSYETLEERLLEALELPVRPRARILACGHYVGPSSTNFDSSASESSDADESDYEGKGNKALWCDICSLEVKYSTLDIGVEKGRRKRFEVKVYASNGLMRAGAWAAAWREMERVDVEIEPFVDGNVVKEIIGLADAAAAAEKAAARAEVERKEQLEAQRRDEEAQRREEEDFDLMQREQREQSPPPRIIVDGNDITDAQIEEEQLWASRREMEETEERRRKYMEEERLREIYGDQAPSSPEPLHNPSSHEKPATRGPNRRSHEAYRRHIDEDSLPALLLEAVKVLMRDRKNIAILVLSVLVLGLALNRAGTTHRIHIQPSRDFGRVYAEVDIFNDGGPESAGEAKDTPIDLSTTPILANVATSSIEVVASIPTIQANMNSPVVAVEPSSFAVAATNAEVVASSPSSNKQVHASIVAKEHTKIDEVLEQEVVTKSAVQTPEKAIESVTMEESIAEETVEEPGILSVSESAASPSVAAGNDSVESVVVEESIVEKTVKEPAIMGASESAASPSITAHDDSVEPSLTPGAASKANVNEDAAARQPEQPKQIATEVEKPVEAEQLTVKSLEAELEQEIIV